MDELKGYRAELARPYLTDVSFKDEVVKTEYLRMQHERKASHILITLSQNAAPADTLVAWNKITDIRKQIIDGADFNEMAAKYSNDPSAAQNKGSLGYFSAFQMIYPFENAAFNTPIGQVSSIIRTQYGYHIIKVEDEREVSGELRVAHIMFLFPQKASDETVAKLKLHADSVRSLITPETNFAEMVKKYSEDKSTLEAGGEMKWFTSTNFPVKEFAEAAFELKKDGEISNPIRTQYGWHIIKRLELRKIQPFEVLKPDLENRIKQDAQISTYSDDVFEQKLKKEYHFKFEKTNLAKLETALFDTTGRVNLSETVRPLKNLSLFSFANLTYTCGDFANYLKKQNYIPKSNAPEARFGMLFENFTREKLLEYEDTQIEVKHPDFANIFKEYHDGILLFNISKDKIWDVASNDTVRLENYYNNTTKKYSWNERFKGFIIQAKNQTTRIQAETMLESKEMTKEELNNIFNQKDESILQITELAVEKGENPIVDFYIWKGPKPADFNETTTFVHGKTTQNEPKTLKDAWGLYSSDFQEQIEKEWMNSLRAKYPIVVNKKVLRKIAMIK